MSEWSAGIDRCTDLFFEGARIRPLQDAMLKGRNQFSGEHLKNLQTFCKCLAGKAAPNGRFSEVCRILHVDRYPIEY